jgi:hypothetical protein
MGIVGSSMKPCFLLKKQYTHIPLKVPFIQVDPRSISEEISNAGLRRNVSFQVKEVKSDVQNFDGLPGFCYPLVMTNIAMV